MPLGDFFCCLLSIKTTQTVFVSVRWRFRRGNNIIRLEFNVGLFIRLNSYYFSFSSLLFVQLQGLLREANSNFGKFFGFGFSLYFNHGNRMQSANCVNLFVKNVARSCTKNWPFSNLIQHHPSISCSRLNAGGGILYFAISSSEWVV